MYAMLATPQPPCLAGVVAAVMVAVAADEDEADRIVRPRTRISASEKERDRSDPQIRLAAGRRAVVQVRAESNTSRSLTWAKRDPRSALSRSDRESYCHVLPSPRLDI